MPLGFDTHSLKHRQPHVAERRVLWQDEMLSQFQIRSSTCNDGGAVGQVVNRADVRSESHGGVIKEARSAGFFRGLELVDEAGEQFAVDLVALLGSLHALARGVMAHIVSAGFEIETLQEGAGGQTIGQRAGAVGLQRGDNELIHDFNLSLPLQARSRLIEWSLYLGHIEPVFVFVEAGLDVANTLKIFVQLVGVCRGEPTLDALCFG